jgi:hypothetical protein
MRNAPSADRFRPLAGQDGFLAAIARAMGPRQKFIAAANPASPGRSSAFWAGAGLMRRSTPLILAASSAGALPSPVRSDTHRRMPRLRTGVRRTGLPVALAGRCCYLTRWQGPDGDPAGRRQIRVTRSAPRRMWPPSRRLPAPSQGANVSGIYLRAIHWSRRTPQRETRGQAGPVPEAGIGRQVGRMGNAKSCCVAPGRPGLEHCRVKAVPRY